VEFLEGGAEGMAGGVEFLELAAEGLHASPFLPSFKGITSFLWLHNTLNNTLIPSCYTHSS
jgi:hypothetical protein